MKNRKSRKPAKKLTLQSLALGCTVLAAVLAGAWVLFPTEIEKAMQQFPQVVGLEQKPAQETSPLPILKQEQKTETAALSTQSGEELPGSIQLPSAATQPALPAPTGADKPAAPPMTCSQATGSLRNFVEGLEKKDYLQDFKLKQPVRKHLEGLKDKLAAKPPTVVRETDDLYTVIANTAHFFRVLGKDNIRLLKTLLEHEQGGLENLANALYAASVGPDCQADTVQLPFSMAYDYSVFFLNTIGGRSYLFRRAARVRLLINYYALLLIDEAANRNLNTHGTDISGLIQPLIQEIEATNQLARKEEYVNRLRELAERHPVR
ncbi:hypothetical protein [Candidatus Electronema sp. PJ]|uniref:hypothetical protein n=1 Tax=Candidatus Electronema sp. PJ TaxID=3401572 RepID=UPI003AA7E16C